MHMLFAHKQIDACDGQDDGKQDDSRRRCVGGIAAAVPVEHVVYIAYDGVHAGRVQIGAKQRHRVAVGFKRADKSRDDQIEEHGGNHGQGDPEKYAGPSGAVHSRGVVADWVYTGERTCQNKNFKGHDDPDSIKAEHEHFRPVGAFDEVHGAAAEAPDQEIDQSVGVGCFFKENHKHQTHRQRVSYIGQEKNRLKQFLQGLNGAERHRDQKRKRGGERHGNDNKNKSVFQRLQKICVVQDIGIIVAAGSEKCLGSGVVAFLKGVDKHVD